MKSVVRSFGVAGVILMLASVQSASAQITSTVEFTTSFPFTVGNATVPAGSYRITPDSDNPAIFELIGGRTAVLFETEFEETSEAPSKTEVVFTRYGDRYVLKSIWMAGDRTGAETLAVEGEKHTSKRPGPTTEHRVAAVKKPSAPALSVTGK